jgi:hypothetical protein
MKLKRLSKIKNTIWKLEDTIYCDSNLAGFKNLRSLIDRLPVELTLLPLKLKKPVLKRCVHTIGISRDWVTPKTIVSYQLTIFEYLSLGPRRFQKPARSVAFYK